jgi:hypothetical protein
MINYFLMLDGAFCTHQREKKNVTQKKEKIGGSANICLQSCNALYRV